MKKWLRWLRGDSYLTGKNPFSILGRFILSLWIAIIAACAVIMAGIFITDPGAFSQPENIQTCRTVEYNGESIDTCDYLTP